MKKELIKLANRLDAKGLYEEADCLDNITKNAADDSINEAVYVVMVPGDPDSYSGHSGFIVGVLRDEKSARDLVEMMDGKYRYLYARYDKVHIGTGNDAVEKLFSEVEDKLENFR